MSISLKLLETGEVINLPPELFWQDEFSWCTIKSDQQRGLTGSLIVESSKAKGGRPVTLGAEDDMNWATRTTVERLMNWANNYLSKIEVTMVYPDVPDRVFQAIFDRKETPVEATPVLKYESPQPTDWFHLTIKLLEVI